MLVFWFLPFLLMEYILESSGRGCCVSYLCRALSTLHHFSASDRDIYHSICGLLFSVLHRRLIALLSCYHSISPASSEGCLLLSTPSVSVVFRSLKETEKKIFVPQFFACKSLDLDSANTKLRDVLIGLEIRRTGWELSEFEPRVNHEHCTRITHHLFLRADASMENSTETKSVIQNISIELNNISIAFRLSVELFS